MSEVKEGLLRISFPCLMEPGTPGLHRFTNGRADGAVLDRNGLRPSPGTLVTMEAWCDPPNRRAGHSAVSDTSRRGRLQPRRSSSEIEQGRIHQRR